MRCETIICVIQKLHLKRNNTNKIQKIYVITKEMFYILYKYKYLYTFVIYINLFLLFFMFILCFFMVIFGKNNKLKKKKMI